MRNRCRSWCELRTTGHRWIGRIRCMSGVQMIDMSCAGGNVERMSKMIQIRNVPDEMHKMLKMQAAAAGMSLSDYIKRELGHVTEKPTMREVDARVQARGRSRVKTENVVQVLRESRGE